MMRELQAPCRNEISNQSIEKSPSSNSFHLLTHTLSQYLGDSKSKNSPDVQQFLLLEEAALENDMTFVLLVKTFKDLNFTIIV